MSDVWLIVDYKQQRSGPRRGSYGLDECWLDVTGSEMLFGSGENVAQELRETIKRELGITVSVGV